MSAAAGIEEAAKRFGTRMRSGSIDNAARAYGPVLPTASRPTPRGPDTPPGLGQGRRTIPGPRGTVVSRADLAHDLAKPPRLQFDNVPPHDRYPR